MRIRDAVMSHNIARRCPLSLPLAGGGETIARIIGASWRGVVISAPSRELPGHADLRDTPLDSSERLESDNYGN
jgi:hypothetical protein